MDSAFIRFQSMVSSTFTRLLGAFCCLAERVAKTRVFFMETSTMEILPVLLDSHHYTDFINVVVPCLFRSENQEINFHLATM